GGRAGRGASGGGGEKGRGGGSEAPPAAARNLRERGRGSTFHAHGAAASAQFRRKEADGISNARQTEICEEPRIKRENMLPRSNRRSRGRHDVRSVFPFAAPISSKTITPPLRQQEARPRKGDAFLQE